MTKGQQQEHREYIKSATWSAVERQVLSQCPIMGADQILHGKPTQEQMALQQAFISGMVYFAELFNQIGKAPKAKRPQVHARHLLPDADKPQNPNRL